MTRGRPRHEGPVEGIPHAGWLPSWGQRPRRPRASAARRRAGRIRTPNRSRDRDGVRVTPAVHRVGWGFISLYTLAYISTILVFLAPLLVTLALKVNSLVGIEQAPNSLALVAGVGALLAMFANPFFGRLSDRTSSRLGHAAALDGHRPGGRFPRHPRRRGGTQHPGRPRRMVHRPAVLQRAARRHWWRCCPTRSRPLNAAMVAGVLGVCLPIASVSGTFLVQLFTGNQLVMFLAPCAIGGFFILLFAVTLHDRRLAAARPADLVAAGDSPARSTSTPGRARTSPGRSPAASCSCWPTPS